MPKSKVKIKKKAPELTLDQKIVKVLVNYFTTQFILMVLVGFAAWGILELINVEYTVPLAVITGILSGVPVLGMFVSTIVTAVVAVLDDANMWTGSPAWLEGLIVIVIFFIFNKVVDWIIAPVFLGKATKVNPFIVILITTVGTISFGVVGAVLATPLYLVVKTIVEHFIGGR